MMVCFKFSLFLVICTTLLENPASANTVTFVSATGKWKEWTTVISFLLSLDLSDLFKGEVSDAEKCGPRVGILLKQPLLSSFVLKIHFFIESGLKIIQFKI